MTREETKKAIKIMQAYVDGKEIQFYDMDEWHIVTPTWNWLNGISAYRIKPEPHIRPYKNQKEFLKALKEHGGWLLSIDACFATVPVYVDNTGIDLIGGNIPENNYGYERIFFVELLKDFAWIDGAACGVVEE